LDWNKLKDEYTHLLANKKRDIKQLWDDFYQQYPDGEITAKKTKLYQEGITVFVDNLHLQSPKTNAITLLQSRTGIDIAFMNMKKKGLGSTHVRLKTPEDASKLCDYFNTHFIVQESGKDTVGKEEQTRNCIKARLITGKEEELYWENEFKQTGGNKN
jgi:hypothetical protein